MWKIALPPPTPLCRFFFPPFSFFGYLFATDAKALMILMDESMELLMLATNSLKNDMRHTNQYVVGLSLGALGNVGSAEMCRDLAKEMEQLLRNTNPYIRTKAALCCLRLFQKVPELTEDFIGLINTLLNDRNHAVMLAGTELIIYIVENDDELAKNFKRMSLVKKMVKRLLSLVRSGYQPEYDIAGITDPFLQVAILKLLRLLGLILFQLQLFQQAL